MSNIVRRCFTWKGVDLHLVLPFIHALVFQPLSFFFTQSSFHSEAWTFLYEKKKKTTTISPTNSNCWKELLCLIDFCEQSRLLLLTPSSLKHQTFCTSFQLTNTGICSWRSQGRYSQVLRLGHLSFVLDVHTDEHHIVSVLNSCLDPNTN